MWKQRPMLMKCAVRVVSVVILIFVCHMPIQAQMTAQEFDALPEADKRTVFVSILEEREQAVTNLQARSVTKLYNVSYHDGRAGSSIVAEMGRYECELRRKDGNHWASIDWFMAGQPDVPTTKVVTSIDRKAGVARSQAEQAGMKSIFGAISTKEDGLIKAGRFHYWFDGDFDRRREFPIRHLLEHKEAIKFNGLSSDGATVEISLHFETRKPPDTPFQDSRTIWVDPQRGFMPVREERRWEYETETQFWSEIVTDVKEMKQIEDVWFPTHFTQTTTGRVSVEDGYATVWDTTVSEIQLGKMTDADLEVIFGDGVRVEDRIKGVRFVADKTTQSAPPPSELRENPVASRRWWIYGVNFAIILLAILIYAARQKWSKDVYAK